MKVATEHFAELEDALASSNKKKLGQVLSKMRCDIEDTASAVFPIVHPATGTLEDTPEGTVDGHRAYWFQTCKELPAHAPDDPDGGTPGSPRQNQDGPGTPRTGAPAQKRDELVAERSRAQTLTPLSDTTRVSITEKGPKHKPERVFKNNLQRDTWTSYMNSKVVLADVQKAIQQGKSGTSPGDDRIPYDILKMLGGVGEEILARIFTAALTNAELPKQWRTATQVPMHKQKGSTQDPAMYRAISLLSCVGKTFERILENRMQEYLDYYDLIDPGQHGFRKKRSCEMHALYVDLLLAKEGPWTPVAFIDIQKAFPSIRRSSLMQALHEIGITGNIYHTIHNIYNTNESVLEVGGARSKPYKAETGVREGAILSPIIFQIFINQLLVLLREANAGPRVDGQWAGAPGFADDIALVGESLARDPTGSKLQAQLDVVGDFGADHMLHFGYKKTCVLVSRPCGAIDYDVPAFTLKNMSGERPEGAQPDQVQITAEAMYLGFLFTSDGDFRTHMEGIMTKARRRSGNLRSSVLKVDVLPPKLALYVFQTYLIPVLVTGAALWAPSIFYDSTFSTGRWTSSALQDMEVLCNRCLKNILGQPQHATTIAVWRELGWMGVSYSITVKVLCLFRSIQQLPHGHMLRRILRVAASWKEHSTAPRLMDLTKEQRSRLKTKPGARSQPSSFLLHLFAIGDAMGTHVRKRINHQLMQRPKPWSTFQFAKIKKILLVNTFSKILRTTLAAQTISSHYPTTGKWTMLPDIRDIKVSQMGTDYLFLVQLRTGAHCLGRTITKMLRWVTTELCPGCRRPITDDPRHAILFCTHSAMVNLRKRFLGTVKKILELRKVPEHERDTRHPAFIRHVLQLGNGRPHPTTKWARAVVKQWARAIRYQHVTWRKQLNLSHPASASYYPRENLKAKLKNTRTKRPKSKAPHTGPYEKIVIHRVPKDWVPPPCTDPDPETGARPKRQRTQTPVARAAPAPSRHPPLRHTTGGRRPPGPTTAH